MNGILSYCQSIWVSGWDTDRGLGEITVTLSTLGQGEDTVHTFSNIKGKQVTATIFVSAASLNISSKQ
jgi:hypothetical protein